MSPNYAITFDPATIARIQAMLTADARMAEYYTTAMRACVSDVQANAQRFAPVGVYTTSNRTGGNLRRGIRGQVLSPVEGVVGVAQSIPYARRRELGFSGMRDRLGRFYPHDPGSFYLRRGMEASLPFIESTFRTAVQAGVQAIAQTGA